MSVTLVFTRCHDEALHDFVTNQESFDETRHEECASIELGVEHLAVADLVARASAPTSRDPWKEPSFEIITGTAGESVRGDGDYPRILRAEDVAAASRLMNEVSFTRLREAFDLDRLKADYGEIETWLWDALGPNALEDRLIPMFERLKEFFNHASERRQHVVASWY